MTTGVASACPQCGAPLRFGGAHSLAACCGYCRSAVLRKGADLELAGKVPDLVATDTRLSLGITGSLAGDPFTVLGRLQLSRGDAVWNEWYAAFPKGFGWVAEAQGRLFVTRRIEAPAGLPRLPALHAGRAVELAGAGELIVDEVDQARLVSFEGELPFRPHLGATYHYADCTGPGGSFVTLDYGTGEEDPELYAGREVEWSALGLPGPAPPVAGSEKAAALTCPSCGGPIALQRSDTRAATCPACHGLLDVSRGALRVVGILEQRDAPPIPLGAKGTLLGESLEVLGWLRRSMVADGETYAWDELLLHGAGGYRWLSLYQGHWLFLKPIPGGKASGVEGKAYRCDGRNFKHFQTAEATTDQLQGEFYWEIRAGEKVRTEDYVSPPYLLSVERTEGEVAWTRGEYVAPGEVWKAFQLPGRPRRAVGVAPAQPNPWRRRSAQAWMVGSLALAVIGLLAFFFSGRASHEVVATLEVPLTAGQVTLSEPFELAGGPQAVAIEASTAVRQAWVGLDVALIEEATGESELLGIELSHASGVEDGEAWTEGSNRGRAVQGNVRDGRYLLRVEPMIERSAGGTIGRTAEVRVLRGALLLLPLVLALLAVAVWPLAATLAMASFEKRRWAESDHA